MLTGQRASMWGQGSPVTNVSPAVAQQRAMVEADQDCQSGAGIMRVQIVV